MKSCHVRCRWLLAILLLFPAQMAAAQGRPAPAAQPSPTPADGSWRGQSDAGSCGQPMEVVISVQSGLVEGTGRETSGKTALLWSYHGRARPDGTLELLGHASAFPPQNARQVKLNGRLDGTRLTLGETGGCARRAVLSRG
jgi:hypothetical protein